MHVKALTLDPAAGGWGGYYVVDTCTHTYMHVVATAMSEGRWQIRAFHGLGAA